MCVVCAIALCSLTGCGGKNPGGHSALLDADVTFYTSTSFTTSRKPAAVSSDFREAYAEFALNLLRKCEKGDNTLVSPLSVMTALAMTANGADNKTLTEMLAVLCGGRFTTEELNTQLFNFYEGLGNTKDAKFRSANAIWITSDPNVTPKTEFIDVISNTYRAQIAKAPLYEKKTVDAINEWCSQNTDEMIQKVLEYSDVDANTLMVLLNALCFDAVWEKQYDSEQDVSDGTFHGAKGDQNAKMMYSTEKTYLSGAEETGFVKYYKGRQYAFVALLPGEGLTVSEYLANLDAGRIAALIDSADTSGGVHTAMPKFSFDWGNSVADVLVDLGMVDAFSNSADFSKLFDVDSYISDVIHKTHIDVDESGTRAAAVTAVILETKAIAYENYSVVLDRPFVYAIVDTATWLPVFIGAVNYL